jgi:hypothetical protein
VGEIDQLPYSNFNPQRLFSFLFFQYENEIATEKKNKKTVVDLLHVQSLFENSNP